MSGAKIYCLVVFVVVYAALVLWKRRRTEAIWVGCLALLVGRILSPREAFHAVEWNVIGIFAGILLLAEVFTASGMPVRIADLLIDRAKNVGLAILYVCLFSGFVSIFVENVATVLIVAPIALEVSRRARISPTPFLVGIAISSNLQGAGTLIGDPPSMILAGFLKMNFNDFFVYQGKPSIFWSVQIGAIASAFVLWLIYRRHRQPVVFIEPPPLRSWTPTLSLVVLIVLLALSPIFDPDFHWLGGTICMVMGLVMLLWDGRGEPGKTSTLLKHYDWNTTFFLVGVFIIVAALVKTGLIDDFARIFSAATGDRPVVIYIALVAVSVLFSAFVDNIPYITTMIPVVSEVARNVGANPVPLIFGMLLGASLGGNITPFGASANVVAVGLLRKEGLTVSTGEFVRIGLPFTLAATSAGALFLWLTWH
jgi:Na+/H+ antiporter NhaD/arsenite permease-like protein